MKVSKDGWDEFDLLKLRVELWVHVMFSIGLQPCMVRVSDQMVSRPYLSSLVHKAITALKGSIANKGDCFMKIVAEQGRQRTAKKPPATEDDKHEFDGAITNLFENFLTIDQHCSSFDATQYTGTRTELLTTLNCTKVKEMEKVPNLVYHPNEFSNRFPFLLQALAISTGDSNFGESNNYTKHVIWYRGAYDFDLK